MIKTNYIVNFILVVAILFSAPFVRAQNTVKDSLQIIKKNREENFYDSLAYRANKRKVTSWLYDAFISSPGPIVDEKEVALEYFKSFKGELISSIRIKPLDVFGPSLTDTTKEAKNWLERSANLVHTKSNLKTIRKQLLFKIGDALDPELMAENERLLRQLSYLKDVRFLVEPDSLYPAFVNILVITKDRFSFGVSGGVSGTKSGNVEFYDKNVLGVGHEISVRFVAHVDEEPYLGIETFYRINNIGGSFINTELGYLNTYLQEGFVFRFNRPFVTSEIKWGYGMESDRLFRTERITENHPIVLDPPISESYNNIWVGHSFNLKKRNGVIPQLTPTIGVHNLNFFDVPGIPPGSEHFFANQTLYLAGLTLSKRSYVQDKLIYSYGVVEDIPQGFNHELLYGYDANEFGDRHFLQLFSSNGTILPQKGYLYLSLGANGYLKEGRFEEGLIIADMNFFTRLKQSGNKQVRSFANMNYTIGIGRYPLEYLTLSRNNYIRGFTSKEAIGQQRLSLKLEHVVFMAHEFYGFKTAFFGFADLGIIGSNERIIFRENYYSGLGVGVRLHNENLVFETFQLRLAFYPFHPDDMGFVGFILDEQPKTRFNSLEPTAPKPIPFQ